jgi:peptidoglycan hydrolase-like protein with peptidoglycan-binding domain
MGLAAPARCSTRTTACIVLILGGFFLTAIEGSAHAALDDAAPEHFPLASSTIPREAIEDFLFRISDRVKGEVLTLDGNVIQELPVPILFDVLPEDLNDTWGVPRPGGRVHEGVDILAERGAIVVSPTDAVVTNVGFDPSGGNYCITANPGGEQFYYAHLESIADTVEPGAHLKAGDIIGSVGNTGNAEGRAPHLHFGIYYRGSAVYPNPRLTHTFSLQQADPHAVIKTLQYDLTLDARGAGVHVLQGFLIMAARGPAAEALAHAGATGYFGPLTRAALAEYQEAEGVTPARGYFGSRTRAVLIAELLSTKEAPQTISRGSATDYPHHRLLHTSIHIIYDMTNAENNIAYGADRGPDR